MISFSMRDKNENNDNGNDSNNEYSQLRRIRQPRAQRSHRDYGEEQANNDSDCDMPVLEPASPKAAETNKF